MKDSEFIELLNLYLDHEISAADAVKLEAEVQNNPTRRRVYQDYCRMQKACKILTQDFASDDETADRKIVSFEQAAAVRKQRNRVFAMGGVLTAAAACIAAVFVFRAGSSTPDATPSNGLTQTSPAPKADLTPAANPTVAVAVSEKTERATNEFSLRRNAQQQALAIAAHQTDPQFAWLQNVRLEPVQLPVPANQLRFDANPNLQPDNNARSTPQDVQWTAIRFQK